MTPRRSRGVPWVAGGVWRAFGVFFVGRHAVVKVFAHWLWAGGRVLRVLLFFGWWFGVHHLG